MPSSKIVLFLLLLAVLCLPSAAAIQWLPFGPYGGDARALAADPHDSAHVYLGTVNGLIYESRDGGRRWERLARIDGRDDFIVDAIIVDPANSRRILAGVYELSSPQGGLYISEDGGRTWISQPDMAGQSIRAMAYAPSDSRTVVAGTLTGVYRSQDGGVHWQLISPEIHEIASVAIDPKDPNIIYAGTWHLPWKTTDGGEHWTNIKKGVIEDSDVFSIIVDPEQPNVVYASACSGIYKSENGGEKFAKIEGIPSSARRTRVLMQDPQHRNIVFAGTTEGLYRTSDEGKNWRLMTGPELTVNDVYIDPGDSNRVLLATDRSGVLASNDGGFTFSPSNDGFTSRQITSFVVDARRPADLYVGVVNDKAWGGVFTSGNGGVSWSQQSQGLDSRDVKSLEQASDGTLLAGTDHGIYRLADGVWSKTDIARAQPKPVVRKPVVKPASSHRAPVVRKASLKKAPVMKAPEKKEPEKAAEAKPSGFDGAVYAMTRVGDAVYAATSEGVLRSGSAGMSWEELRPLAGQEWRFIAAHRSRIFAASLHTAVVSGDGGESWEPVDLPGELTQVAAIAVDGEGSLWVGGGEGVFYSEDDGATWQRPPHFTVYDVNSLYYDEAGQRVLVTANNRNTNVYAIQSQAKTVKLWDSGWHLRMVRPVGDYLVGATLFDGIVVQPRMVASPFQDAH